MDNKVLDIVKNVDDKTIGSELSSVKLYDNATENMYKEFCDSLIKIIEDRKVIRDDEELFMGIDIQTGKHCYIIKKKCLYIDSSLNKNSKAWDFINKGFVVKQWHYNMKTREYEMEEIH